MPRTLKSPTPVARPKAHRSSRSTGKSATLPAPTATVELFSAVAHREEIAEVAYRKWLERVGSPEEDWRKAEDEVRAKYLPNA